MQYPREQLEQIFLQLPPELRIALFSEMNAVFIGQIADKFKLPEEKIPELAGQVGLVIMGLLPPENLAKELETILNLDASISKTMGQEIDLKIFAPVRISLRKIYGQITPEEISMQRTPLPAAPPAAERRPVFPPLPVRPRPTPETTVPPLPTAFPTGGLTPAPSRPISPPIRPVTPPPIRPTAPPAGLPVTPPISRPATPAPTVLPYGRPVVPPPAAAAPRPVAPLTPSWRMEQPRPFFPARPVPVPGVILPKTVTPSVSSQRPAYESPALSPKPFAPASSTTPGRPVPPAAGLKPEAAGQAEPIDLSKLGIDDPAFRENIVDLKNLE